VRSYGLPVPIVSLNRIQEISSSQFLTPHFGIVHEAERWLDHSIKELLVWDSIVGRMLKEDRMAEEI
jgi:hypothetical protein